MEFKVHIAKADGELVKTIKIDTDEKYWQSNATEIVEIIEFEIKRSEKLRIKN